MSRCVRFFATVGFGLVATSLLGQPPTKPAEPRPGAYTPVQLIEVLTKLGYEPNVYGDKKDRCWVSLNRGIYKTTVNFTISNDGTILWFDTPLTTVTFPAQSPPKAMKKLLEENEKIGPAHYVFDASDKRFHLQQPNANRDWTPAGLRKKLEAFDDLLRNQEPNWRIDNFLRLAPVPAEKSKPELDLLQGNWRLVEGMQNGVAASPDVLAQNKVIITISGNHLESGVAPNKQEWSFFVDPNHQPKAVDFIGSTGRVEAGIYKLEGDRLTIHLSAVGLERPANFTTPPGDKRNVLVLVIQK